MRRWTALTAAALMASIGAGAALAQSGRQSGQLSGQPFPLFPGSSAPAAAVPACDLGVNTARLAKQVRVSTQAPAAITHGGRIEVTWQVPSAQRTKYKAFLIGVMADTVRFEGQYTIDADGVLDRGPGFVALPARSRAPFDIKHGAGRTRVVIPITGTDAPRIGKLAVRPYAAGPLEIEWSVVAVQRDCETKGALAVSTQAIAKSGPYTVAAGSPRIVVQDFVTPDPRQELASSDGAQRLLEVEVSADSRYRLDIFERRYRVFDRSTGAKLAERSGVKPRFSPDGRFVVASVGDADLRYPTNFEVVDLVAGNVVARVGGPIVGWSNGDALLLDGGRAYQALRLVNTLIDPVDNKEGNVASWLTYFPGCGTCDAWTGSNIRIDWDQMAVLRADSGEARAMGIALLAEGRKVETSSFGDEEAVPLHNTLRQIYGQPNVTLAKGWAGTVPLKITHPGRGYDGYTDDDTSLTPEEKGRASQTQFLAPRRLALSEGRVLRAADLQPSGLGAARDTSPAGPSTTPATPTTLEKGYVADELAKLGLKLSPATAIAEIEIPRPADWGDPVIRPWPDALKAEIAAVNPELQGWFKGRDEDDRKIIVGAWRLRTADGEILLLQHGEPAMTVNGAHQIRFDLLAVSGAARGRTQEIAGLGGLFSQYVGREHSIARVFAASDNRSLIAVPGTGKAVVAELTPTQAEPPLVDLTEPTLLCGFHEDTARGLIVQNNCDGQFFVFRPSTGAAPIVSGRVLDNEVIVYSPEGFYASTYEGAHFVHVAFPGLTGVHSFEQFATALEKPDAIRTILERAKPQVPQPVLAPPPGVDVWVRSGAGPNSPLAIDIKAAAASGLAAIEIYEDGGIVQKQSVSGKGKSLTIQLSRRPHVRTVSVVAIDQLGFRSRPATVAIARQAAARTNTLHVIAIGVDTYERLGPLSGARADAEALIGALKSAPGYYRDVKVTLRTNEAATPEIVRTDIAAAVATATADDTILVFFAGHGGLADDGLYFMATSKTDNDRLAGTAIDWQATAQLLGTAKARVIAVIDACHSGQTGLVTPTNDGAVTSLANATTAPMVVLAASKGRQISEEMPNGGGGVFTQSLARLIARDRDSADLDRDGTLSVSELYRSLKTAVETQTRGRQTPWLVRRNLAGDPPLL